MAKVRIQLVTSKDLISRIIRWMTWSDYSHVDFVMPSGMLLGANVGGVQFRKPDYHKFSRRLVLEAELSQEEYEKLNAFLLKQAGKPYDYTALFGFLARRDWACPDKWFCSELCAAAFQEAGKPLLRTEDLYRITPRDVSVSPIFAKISEE